MTRRYYLSDLPPVAALAVLPNSESQHAIKVMRIQVGETVELFDGRGTQADATVVSVTRKECSVRIEHSSSVDREPNRELTFAIALPKPDRCRELIERLTELGVQRVVPIVAVRTQRGPSENLIGKLRRAVIEACKQSGRNVLMEITEPMSLAEYVDQPDSTPAIDSTPAKWIAHPDGPILDFTQIVSIDSASLLIGPEGGWTEEEINIALDAGFKKVGLGKRIYRIETAAVYLAARLVDH
ncbi:RsmE family RNA methyltransferase [Planctomycetes bacterium K23_9]|uniref:Ribosomal RNA small subunit methyltransferase E n=1 Tax=Stieleria marina TaxID=1930275 RepID=A0A517NTA9_9BACT|nr:Ribosomal RNA small subunit methyltransferase E [Planctomycetes bacterium K23_9]